MSENRRDYYRVRFYLDTVKVYPEKSGGLFEGSIVDISVKGISFRLVKGYSFSVRDTRFIVEFEIEGKSFKRVSEIVRFERDCDGGSSFYAMRFINDSEEEQSNLYQALIKSEAKRKF